MKDHLSGETVQRVAREHDAVDRGLVIPTLPPGSALREEVVGALWMMVGDYLDGDPDAERWLRSEVGEEHLRVLGFSPARFMARLREIESDPLVREQVARITNRHARAAAWLHAMTAPSRKAA